MRQAKDLMTPHPRFVQSGEELRETVHVFLNNDIRYAPVVTPMQDVLGLLSEFGLIRAALRHYLDPDRHEKVVHHQDILEEAHFVEEDAALEDVVKALIRSPSHRVLVTNKQKKLVGIISPKDILRFIMGEQKKTSDLKHELEVTKAQAEKLASQLSSLQESLQKYQSLYNESPYMMHSVDESGQIILANKKIHETLGYDNNELIGKAITDIYPKSMQTEAYQGLARIIKDGYHHRTYTSMVTKSGGKVRVDIASSSLKDKYGKFIGTITISREVDSENLLRALNGLVSIANELPESLRNEIQAEIAKKNS